MNSKLIILAVCLVICAVAVNADKGGKGHGKGGKHHHKKQCLGEDIPEDENQMKIMKECWKEHKGSDDKDDESNQSSRKKGGGGKKGMDPCVAACIMEKQGTVDSNGKYDVEKAKKMITDGKLPQKAKDSITASMQTCADENAGPFSKDDGCKSYAPLAKCNMGAYMKGCKKED